jgi:hypothetical protein
VNGTARITANPPMTLVPSPSPGSIAAAVPLATTRVTKIAGTQTTKTRWALYSDATDEAGVYLDEVGDDVVLGVPRARRRGEEFAARRRRRLSRRDSAMTRMRPTVEGRTIEDMSRTFLFVSSFNPEAAGRAALDSPVAIDLAVISPSEAARETAGFALGGRWVFTVEEPLFVARAFAESGADVLARVAQAMRGLAAYEARAPLAVLDGLDLLGAGAFSLDEAGLLRAADDLERALSLR